MTLAKTASGFEIELDDTKLDDMELIDALHDLGQKDTLALSQVVIRLLGREGRERLYEHLRDTDGRVAASAVSQAVGELLTSFAAGKNFSSSPT